MTVNQAEDTISIEERQGIDEILSGFRRSRDIVIPALQAIQNKYSYLSSYALEKTAEVAGVTPNVIAGVATFYAQFRFNKPGRHQVKVCLGTACHVLRGQEVLESIERELNITDGQTTPDQKFSLMALRCIGACALAPVVVIDHDTHGKVNPTKVKEILDQYQ